MGVRTAYVAHKHQAAQYRLQQVLQFVLLWHTDKCVQQLQALCGMLIAEAWADAWLDISVGCTTKVIVTSVSGLGMNITLVLTCGLHVCSWSTM